MGCFRSQQNPPRTSASRAIDQSFAEHIFEPFARAHKNSTYEGMGIGLSIVRRAVEHHDGRVWVEAEPGKGACFYFTLQKKEIPNNK